MKEGVDCYGFPSESHSNDEEPLFSKSNQYLFGIFQLRYIHLPILSYTLYHQRYNHSLLIKKVKDFFKIDID